MNVTCEVTVCFVEIFIVSGVRQLAKMPLLQNFNCGASWQLAQFCYNFLLILKYLLKYPFAMRIFGK